MRGLDFMDNFSPVVNDGTFQVVITQMTIKNGMPKLLILTDNAFLN